jgi:hypothetical protein
MKKAVLGLVAGLVVATPASALSLKSGACASDSPCVFNGTISTIQNTPSKSGYGDAEDLFNAAHPGSEISLKDFLVSANDANFAVFGSITNPSKTSGDWTLDGYLVDFIIVEAPRYSVLYSINDKSSGSWSTDDVPPPTPGVGSPISETNILFFGVADVDTSGGIVPEPSTWLMLLTGFLGLGALMRAYRKQAAAT